VHLRGDQASHQQRCQGRDLRLLREHPRLPPGYEIADKIQIHNTGLQDDIDAAKQKAQLDSAIEDKFKAQLADEPSLKSEKIQYTAFHGTLTLKGTVRNIKERQQAEDLAKKVPDVQHVVNELQVRAGKPSPANS